MILVVLGPENPIIEVFGPLGEVFGCLHLCEKIVPESYMATV